MWLCFYRLSVVSLTFSISYDLHICPVLLFSYASYISFNRDRTSYSHTGTLIFEFLPPLFYCIYDIDIQGIFLHYFLCRSILWICHYSSIVNIENTDFYIQSVIFHLLDTCLVFKKLFSCFIPCSPWRKLPRNFYNWSSHTLSFFSFL